MSLNGSTVMMDFSKYDCTPQHLVCWKLRALLLLLTNFESILLHNFRVTIDLCLPTSKNGYEGGCQFIPVTKFAGDNPVMSFDDPVFTGAIFYQDSPSLTEEEAKSVVKWVTSKVTQLRTPFCWKQSYGRGVGKVLTDCPAGKEKIGALCYTPCKSGYSRQGTFDCQQECKPGWRDDGLFCRRAEYGRGAGYPWIFGDPLNDSGMFSRCERDHGRGNCEKSGLVVYPKCAPGYSAFGCCICRPAVPNCAQEGYNPGGVDLSCPVKIELGDPTPLICESGLEKDGALCYPYCSEGFNGIGPVCWQLCDTDQFDCAAGCAANVSRRAGFISVSDH